MGQNEHESSPQGDESVAAGPVLPGSPSTGPSSDPDLNPGPDDDADSETDGA